MMVIRRTIHFVCVELLVMVLLFYRDAMAYEAEKQLVQMLLRDYTREIRPVKSHDEVLCLNFSVSISQLHEVNEKDQVIKTSLWLNHVWRDVNLIWNPDDYDGIERLFIPSEKLWYPDIVLYNNADGQYEVTQMTKAQVKYDGTVAWVPPAIYKSSCEIDVTYFPFDFQKCVMKFGVWTYDTSLVDLTLAQETVDMEKDYQVNGEWDIIGAPGRKHVQIYPSCCGFSMYSDITFSFQLVRKPLFYTVNLIVPCILISFLTVLVFYLPSDCGEKITLCISVLLALTVFLLLIAEIIPATSLVVPLIGKYLMFTMVMVTLSIIITVIVLNVHHRAPSTHTMPNWVRIVFLEILPKALCMNRPDMGDEGVLPPWEKQISSNAEKGQNNIANERRRQSRRYSVKTEDFIDDNKSASRKSPQKLSDINKAIEGIQYIAQHLKNEDEFSSVREDWKYVAMVLDRLFLWIFIVMCVVGTCTIILDSPQIMNPGNTFAEIPYDDITNNTCGVTDDMLSEYIRNLDMSIQ